MFVISVWITWALKADSPGRPLTSVFQKTQEATDVPCVNSLITACTDAWKVKDVSQWEEDSAASLAINTADTLMYSLDTSVLACFSPFTANYTLFTQLLTFT